MDNLKIRKIHNLLTQVPDTCALVDDPEKSEAIATAMSVMDELVLEDVGLTDRRVASADYSQCFEVFSCEKFQFAVFIIPAGQKLHLHDHPNMAVLSKLLTGKLKVLSYDAIEAATSSSVTDIPVSSPTLTLYEYPIAPWSLSAVHNNFHEFEAVVNSVVFEALLPPYGDEERVCNYYEPLESPLVPGGFLLRIIDPPEDGPVGIEI